MFFRLRVAAQKLTYTEWKWHDQQTSPNNLNVVPSLGSSLWASNQPEYVAVACVGCVDMACR